MADPSQQEQSRTIDRRHRKLTALLPFCEKKKYSPLGNTAEDCQKVHISIKKGKQNLTNWVVSIPGFSEISEITEILFECLEAI